MKVARLVQTKGIFLKKGKGGGEGGRKKNRKEMVFKRLKESCKVETSKGRNNMKRGGKKKVEGEIRAWSGESYTGAGGWDRTKVADHEHSYPKLKLPRARVGVRETAVVHVDRPRFKNVFTRKGGGWTKKILSKKSKSERGKRYERNHQVEKLSLTRKSGGDQKVKAKEAVSKTKRSQNIPLELEKKKK